MEIKESKFEKRKDWSFPRKMGLKYFRRRNENTGTIGRLKHTIYDWNNLFETSKLKWLLCLAEVLTIRLSSPV